MRLNKTVKSLASIAVFALALGLFCSPVQALTLSDVDGTWSNTTNAGSTLRYQYDRTVAYGNHSENRVLWGNSSGYGKSGLGFTGATASTFEIGETFEIGQLRHFNFPVYAPYATSTQLSIDLSFIDPSLSETFDFTFGINETRNTARTITDPANDDFIFFNNSFSSATFDIDGILYTLELIGFGETSSALVDQFRSTERQINSTLLWGVITTPQVAPVPEPSTFLLLGAGLIGFGIAKKQMKK